jgi:hypothetical protein
MAYLSGLRPILRVSMDFTGPFYRNMDRVSYFHSFDDFDDCNFDDDDHDDD